MAGNNLFDDSASSGTGVSTAKAKPKIVMNSDGGFTAKYPDGTTKPVPYEKLPEKFKEQVRKRKAQQDARSGYKRARTTPPKNEASASSARIQSKFLARPKTLPRDSGSAKATIASIMKDIGGADDSNNDGETMAQIMARKNAARAKEAQEPEKRSDAQASARDDHASGTLESLGLGTSGDSWGNCWSNGDRGYSWGNSWSNGDRKEEDTVEENKYKHF